MLSKLIPKSGKYHYRFALGSLFVVVGFVITLISIIVTMSYQLNSIHKEFDHSAKESLSSKKELFRNVAGNIENYLLAIDKSSEFDAFIKGETKEESSIKEHVENLVMLITRSDSNIMKFRFIDKDGHENIKVQRDSIGAFPYVSGKEDFQDKAERYYFEEAKNSAKERVWFSKIDLNVEHGKIQLPISPTLRIAKAYYSKGEFKGILIINIFMKNILSDILKSELFYVGLIDKDSNILVSNLSGYEDGKSEWTKYIDDAKDVKFTTDKNGHNVFIKFLFQQRFSTVDLSDVIQNGEGLKIVLEEKTEKLKEHTDDIVDYIAVMGIIIFGISFPVSLILSRYPLKLHKKLEKSKTDLEDHLDIMDKYIYMSKTDLKGDITEVSTAFVNLSGYSRDELIGKNHRILKDPNTPKLFYKEMWSTLLSKKSWSGVVKNISKSGEAYWTKSHITPIIEDNKIVGYTAIRENITDQKLIEAISIKDELTHAYNRRYFNQIFPQEYKRAKRKGDILCIAMLDIDHFKKYNDTYGHIKGDKALQDVVAKISTKLKRASDYLFRVGGEEFIVIYSDVPDFLEAKNFAVSLVREVEGLRIEHKASDTSDVLTISLGLLKITPECDFDEDGILKRVDELLYSAKEGGRNQVVAQVC